MIEIFFHDLSITPFHIKLYKYNNALIAIDYGTEQREASDQLIIQPLLKQLSKKQRVKDFQLIESKEHFITEEGQLKEYIAGTRKELDFNYDLIGTDFQKRVWQGLLKIPYGSLESYQDIAERLGLPKASRAVGNACGQNPLPILVPCHRVVRKDKGLGGYSGGLHLKRLLLKLESTQVSFA